MTISIHKAIATGAMYTFCLANASGGEPEQTSGVRSVEDDAVSQLPITGSGLRKFAETHQPPQTWYDEDMEGLW